MANLTADDLLFQLAARRPKTHAVGQPDPTITNSAYLDALGRAVRAKLLVSSNPGLAAANLAIANERFAQIGPDVDILPIFGTTHAAPPQPKTINLGEGTFEMSEVRVDNAVYQGVPGKTKVRSPDKRFAFITNNGGTGQFFGLDFDGSAVTGEGTCSIVMDQCNCTNFTRGVDVGFGAGTAVGNHNNGLKLIQSRITRTRFHDSPGGWGIGWYTNDGLEISDCEFVNINNGLKSNNGGNTGRNGRFLRLYFSGISRMEMELQGCGYDNEWTDCYTEHPVFPGGSNANGNDNKLHFSIIYHGDTTNDRQGKNVVHRNRLYCKDRPDGTGMRLDFEIGNQFTVEDNYMEGGGTFVSCFMGDSGHPTTDAQIGPTYVRNNRLVDVRWGRGSAYGPSAGLAQIPAETNNANVQLVQDINRPKPGAGGSVPVDPNTEPPVDSPDNTYIPHDGNKIVAGGHTYTIDNKRLARDGVRDGNGGDVTGLLWYGGKMYKDQGVPAWWVAKNNPPAVGEQYTETTDPRVVTQPQPDTFDSTVDVSAITAGKLASPVAVTVNVKNKTVKVK